MANPAENALSEVLAAYAFAGEVVGAARFGQGHINDTFCVYTQTAEGDCVRYILQRMSAAAFKHPDQLMQNIVGVTDYLRDLIEKDGGDAARETMTVLRTKNGAAYFTDSEGGAWRVYPFVEKYAVPAEGGDAGAVLCFRQGVRQFPTHAEGLSRRYPVRDH